jgi:hypothetical protein
MWCMKCQRDLFECVCQNKKERMEELQKSPHLALPECPQCKKLVYVCECTKH